MQTLTTVFDNDCLDNDNSDPAIQEYNGYYLFSKQIDYGICGKYWLLSVKDVHEHLLVNFIDPLSTQVFQEAMQYLDVLTGNYSQYINPEF